MNPLHFPLASLLESNGPDHDAAWNARTRPGWPEWTAGAEPLHVHHGTAHEGFSTFALYDEGSIGFHFGTIDAAIQQARTAADEDCDARVASCLVLARNPLRTRDLGLWGTRDVLGEFWRLGIIGEAAHDHLEEQACAMSLLAAVEAAGHDSIVYANRTEDPGSDSWLLWRSSSIRSVRCSEFLPGDPRLCPTLSMSNTDYEWNRENERILDEQVAVLRAIARTDVFIRDTIAA